LIKVSRDPRFLATAGEFSTEKFSKSYSFLADKHKTELATLRETLKQARKLLASSPRDLRIERENEVYRLEQAIKRAESMVNKDRLDQVQRDALGKAKKDEELKRQQGKGKWFLKKGMHYITDYSGDRFDMCVAEQRQLMMQARYEALAKEGGAQAVKKAMLKRQKKVSQSEKRSRPYKKHKGVGVAENKIGQ
jgi:ribosomal RNA-processing protein 36